LKNRYTKEVYNLRLVAVKHGKNLRTPYSQYKPEDFEAQAKSDYQSICDLERRISEIKNKIDESNFTTKVTIGDQEMTIIEVLNYKNNILSLKEARLLTLKDLKKRALLDYDKALSENKAKVENFVSSKNSNTANASKSAMELEGETVEAIEKVWAVELIDPLKIDKEIESLENEIEVFKHNIDFVLSESNSITTIEVD
jgi:lipopolysaccharide export LptBFGC system permease protein LptF